MGIPKPILKLVWKNTEKGDIKRLAMQSAPDGVKEICDIPYIDDGKWQHKLDVYYPEDKENEQLPVIVDIHGGGWMYGDKELNKYYNMVLASKGFTVFSMSYTLWPETIVPEQLKEIAEALLWINNNLSSYPCDRKKIMLTGDSAGGQLALYSAVLSRSSVLRDVFSVKDCGLKFTCLGLVSVVADMGSNSIISLYTKGMWGKNYASSPTSRYMNFRDIAKFSNLPPTVLITSSGDVIAQRQTISTYNKIKELGVRTELYNYGKADGKHLPHVFSVLYPYSEYGNDAIDNMLNFYRDTF
ncbi:MAG: alpha/beta hydrolase [Clostridia bacterium]|nr:alpha/beta hydrolase [Clostridia bacterium]